MVVREITKTYEEVIRGSLAQLAERFGREQALGEIVIIVEGATENEAARPHRSGRSPSKISSKPG